MNYEVVRISTPSALLIERFGASSVPSRKTWRGFSSVNEANTFLDVVKTKGVAPGWTATYSVREEQTV